MTVPSRPIGGEWPCLRYETIDSTSDEARRLIAGGGVAVPFAVWADAQTKGRGRGSNAWFSDEDSLTVTLAFDPAWAGIGPGREPLVSLAAALALARAIEPMVGRRLAIRWPNDVEADGRKLAGILAERFDSPEGPRLLVGVGVNVATRFESAPSEVRALATSVVALGAGPADSWGLPGLRHGIYRDFLREFEAALRALAADDPTLLAGVNDRDSLDGHLVRVRQGERVALGIGRGINPDGSLRLETAAGEVAVYGGQVLRDLDV